MDCIAGDPARIFGREEGNDATDIVRLCKTLKRLHAEREVAAGVGLGEVRHIGLDDTGRHRIDADPTGAKQRGKMLHQRINRALGCRIGWDRPDNAACRERRDENDTASFRQDRKQLLDEKEGGANVDGEQPIEILNGGIFDGGGFRDPSIGDKDIEAIADDVAREFRELVRPVGLSRSAATASPRPPALRISRDDTVGFIGATAVMHQDLRTGGGECQRAGAADAAGGAGNECGFSGEVGHDRLLCCLMGLDTHGAQGSAADRNVETSRTNSSGYWWCEPCAESG